MQDRFGAVDVFDETFYPANESECLFLCAALINQMNFHAIVEKREFAQTLRKYVVMVFYIAEYLLAGQKMYFGATPLCLAGDRQGRNGNTHTELDLMNQPVAANSETQPFGQRIDDGHADAVQPPRHLVGIIVKLAAGMEFRHHKFWRRSLQFLVVLDASGNATSGVLYGY